MVDSFLAPHSTPPRKGRDAGLLGTVVAFKCYSKKRKTSVKDLRGKWTITWLFSRLIDTYGHLVFISFQCSMEKKYKGLFVVDEQRNICHEKMAAGIHQCCLSLTLKVTKEEMGHC